MITTINEFLFSNHYLYDSDNRFHLRIKNAKLVNTDIENIVKAEDRLKRALYYYGLEQLDKIEIAQMPILMTFGNIYIRENSRLKLAKIEAPLDDKNVGSRVGNVYIVVIKDKEVVTLLLFDNNMTNGDILTKCKQHDGTEFKAIYDINKAQLNLDDKRRNHVIIDLDISDSEFAKQYPRPVLKNNKLNTKLFNEFELEKIEKEKQNRDNKKSERFITIIPPEYQKLVPEKEYVIYDGMTILVNVNGTIKERKIRRLIVDETGQSRKFSLEFENVRDTMPLEIGKPFIISPKIENEELSKLYDAFDLTPGEPISFQGRITKFNYYSKQKTGSIPKLGVIIKPTKYL